MECAGFMGGVSITTLIISKMKCYLKQNGDNRYGWGFADKSSIDDDETEIETVNVDATNVFYVY